jgi:transcriptional regulator with XRE-family HTH domain
MEAKEFWNRVKQLVKLNNTTQRSLSETIGLSPRTIEVQINRNSVPDVFEAMKIASALGVTVEYLVTGSDSNPYKEQLDKLKASIMPILNEPPEEQK